MRVKIMNVGRSGAVWNASLVDEEGTTVIQVVNQPTEEHAKALSHFLEMTLAGTVGQQALVEPKEYLAFDEPKRTGPSDPT